jgi:uridylate kinase
MMAAAPHIWQVALPICGMSCELLVRAHTESTALLVAEHYLGSSGMEASRAAAAVTSARIRKAHVIGDIFDAIAAQNHMATLPVTTVEYSESCGYAVRCNGEVMDYFTTRSQAEAFAAEFDHITLPERFYNDASGKR